MRTSSSEVLIELDRSRPRGLSAQIEEQIRDAIRARQLPRGTRLPSSRALADDLGVSRGVVVGAFDRLIAAGYLASVPGSGTMVGGGSALPPPLPSPRRRPAGPTVVADFGAGLPDLSLFPRARWMAATRRALGRLPDDHLGYGDPRGLGELRSELVDYLARVRGVRAHEDQVFVGSGFSHAISVIAEVLRAGGHTSIAVEDPHRGAGPQLDYARLTVHGVGVDSHGLVVDALRRTASRVVLVTPAHQAPTGAVLSPARRAELIRWADDVDGYVIEDDYDAEFRYDHQPVGALQGIAPERVIYCGTVSKTMAPGLRLGWIVSPPALVQSIVAARRGTDVHSSTVLHATFAEFLRSGDLDRHLRRGRNVYRRRRDALIDAVARHFPEAVPTGVSAGLQTLLRLPAGYDEDGVVERAAAAGVIVAGLRRFRVGPVTPLPPGLVLGYGRLDAERIERGVALLADAARQGRTGRVVHR